MRPAFSSTGQAAVFLSLLLVLLAAPWLANQTFLPQRDQTYSSQSFRWEKNPWAQKFIFEETNDIDIAFVGSSHIGVGIDTPYVQDKLDEKLGRKTVVRTVTYFYPGFDALYFVTKDLLTHRRVKTLVFYDECSSTHYASDVHRLAPFWYRFGSDSRVMSGLSIGHQAIYYFASVIGMPRNLLELIVSNIPNDPENELTGPFAYLRAPNPEAESGSIQSRLGFDQTYGHGNTNFIPYLPHNEASPADVCVFAPSTATNFCFSEKSLPMSQVYFAKQFALLAKAHGCKLLELHLPLLAESKSPEITETRNWPDLMQAHVCLAGIPTGRLFKGLSEDEIENLFSDPEHLNVNGEKYFTPLITPALIQFYENHSEN